MNILKIIAHFKAVSWVICKLYHNIAVMLGRFSRVWLCATPQSAAHQTPLSLGFSRQEHWSGLPFPSPMHESEKWKWSRLLVTPWTAAHQAPLSMGFARQEYWSGLPLPSPVTLTSLLYFLDFICYHTVFVFLWLISLSIIPSKYIHITANGNIPLTF